MDFLRLIRYKNLLFIILLQCLLKWCVINPYLKILSTATEQDFSPLFGGLDFAFMVVATVLATAGGYVINDYFDTKTDSINRPQTVVVGRSISRSQAITTHWIMSITACILGMLVSYRIGLWQLGLIYPFASGLLWFYSSTYKRQFLLGNLIVAFLSSLVPLLPAMYETPMQIAKNYQTIIDYQVDIYIPLTWAAAFAAFAFLTTLSREIVKDIEDIEGDKQYGRHTLPVALGENKASIIAIAIDAIVFIGIVWIWYTNLWVFDEQSHDWLSTIYIWLLIALPTIWLAYLTIKASTKKDFHRCSIISKSIMLLAVLYLLIAKHNLSLILNS